MPLFKILGISKRKTEIIDLVHGMFMLYLGIIVLIILKSLKCLI